MGSTFYPLFKFCMLAETYMADFDYQIREFFQQNAALVKVMSQGKQET